jgi:hypothetical protein
VLEVQVDRAADLIHVHHTSMNPKSLILPTENSKQIYSRENFDKNLSQYMNKRHIR